MDELSITGDFKIDSVGSSKASGVSPLVIMDGLEVSDDVIKAQFEKDTIRQCAEE